LTAREVTLTVERAPAADGRLPAVRIADLVLAGAPVRADGVVRLPCGSGPPVELDGTLVRTALTARAGDLITLAPVPARTCSGTVHLEPAEHRLTGGRVPAVEVAGAAVVDRGWAPAAAVAGRQVEVQSWAPESRRLRVAGGGSGFLALTEGFNPGWRATGGGRPLTPIRIDGWRQGWVLPPGGDTVVDLVYLPGGWHRAGLVTGVAALLLLAVLVAAPTRRRAPAAGRAPVPDRAGAGAQTWRGGWAVLGLGLAVAVPALLAGAAGLVATVTAVAVPRRVRPAVAGGCLAAAGLLLGLVPTWSAQPAMAQLLAVTAVAVTAAALSDVDGQDLVGAVARRRTAPAVSASAEPMAAAGEPLREVERRPLDNDP
jgi:arabinofuranan 3-O-arabinosyltransferase